MKRKKIPIDSATPNKWHSRGGKAKKGACPQGHAFFNIETKIDKILKIVTMNQQDITELKNDVKQLKERVTKLEERMTSLERSVFLIETEHGDRVKALFDNMKVNENEHKKLENLCLSIKSEIQGTLFSHEKRISKLEGNLVPSF